MLPNRIDSCHHYVRRRIASRVVVILVTLVAVTLPLFAQSESEEPDVADAREAQNPIAHLITLPLQNNTYFDVGPYNKTQNVLLIQPVIPVKLNQDWVLITRWITPLIYQPAVSADSNGQFGLGNVEPQFYFSPAHPEEVIWGLGPQFWLPTATNPMLGTNKWGAGPAAVALTIQGHWVAGALINNVWAGSGSQRVNQLTLQPFVNYNMKGGWYMVSSPVVTSNWKQRSSERWTVPIGGGVGRLFKVAGQPINTNVQVFSNIARPTNAPSWSIRVQVQFLFPNS